MRTKISALLLIAFVLILSVAPAFALNSNGMPDWYPEDVSSFKDFHDPDAPRVVDNADIFTPEEEQQMAEYIAVIQETYGTDLVVFTDDSAYGLPHDRYAMDFHHFNGYGLGDDFNGTCLFICMEPGDRDWWTVWTGACSSFYTESAINQLDDNLEPYMVNGEYGKGVINYIVDVYYLYQVPAWYDDPSLIRNATTWDDRVFDVAELLTESQRTDLQNRIDDLKARYDTDFVILLETAQVGQSTYKTINEFAKLSGFDKKDTFIFSIVDSGFDGVSWNMERFGKYYNDDESRVQHLEKVQASMYADNYYQACVDFLDASDLFLSKGGRFPKNINFPGAAGGGIVAGGLAGLMRTGSMKRKMKTIRKATTANDSVVPGTFNLRRQNDLYINTTVTRVKRQTSSSGSGGRSSYHSSGSSSGGRSYGSGGGRKF